MTEVSTIPIDPQLSEAGPSRSPPRPLSPLVTTLPPLDHSSTDVVMEEKAQIVDPAHEVTTTTTTEDVELLLNISAADVKPSGFMDSIGSDVSPKDPTFPYTPPDDPPQPPQSIAVPSLPPSSLSQPLDATASAPAPPPRSPSPRATSPESTTKGPAKPRRRKNAQAGPSRPAHWLGEDNTIIRCICGILEDDGFTIQCEGCGAWEHGLCFGYQDVESAPDKYLCELCDPRPVDPEAARAKQREARLAEDYRRQLMLPAPEAPKASRSKGKKRPRQTQAVTDVEAEQRPAEPAKDPSPSVTNVKPRRKVAANKPRSRPSIPEPTPGPSNSNPPAFKEPLPPVELDDEYFTVDPWMLEFTPVEANIVRGRIPQRLMSDLYNEWVDAEAEDSRHDQHDRRTVTHSSGLPSPTETGLLRLTPDHILPPTSYDVLAPPVPPVRLYGSDLDALSTPHHVEAIEDAPSFLPLNYAEVASSGVYGRPAIYGVFLDKGLSTGALIGEYRGEVIDCASYRSDPTNQYAGLGMTKPFVRSLGPPVNLMIDARGYGTLTRFVRSSCHPNAVLRPILLYADERERPKLKFGLFACRSIARDEEITLGWEWDDQHVVHTLHTAVLSNIAPDRDFGISNDSLQQIANQYEAVLTHLFGTFASCACIVSATCAMAQMRSLVEGKDAEVELNERGKVNIDFGRLVGAVRGWRRKEMEEHEARKWDLPRNKMPRRSDTSQSGSQRRGDRRLSRNSAEEDEESMAQDGEHDDEDETDEEDTPDVPVNGHVEAEEDVVMEEEDAGVQANQTSTSFGLSSSLSSVPSQVGRSVTTPRRPSVPLDDEDQEAEEEDGGNASDATSATVPRSALSDAERFSPLKPKSVSKGSRKTTSKRSRGDRGPRPHHRKRSSVSDTSSSRVSPPLSTPSNSPLLISTKGIVHSSANKKNRKEPVIDWMDEFSYDKPSRSPRKPESMDIDEPVSVRRASHPSELVKEEARAVVPDQVVAPMADAMEAVPAEDEMTVDPVVEVEEPVREPTPRQPTPPREPTPEPPKKISFAEYLKTRKAKQDVPTPGEEHSSTEEVSTSTVNGNAESASTVPGADTVVENGTTNGKGEAESGGVNFLDFLPSGVATPGLPPASTTTPLITSTALPTESPLATTTPSGYAPRSEYFPQQSGTPSSAFQSRSMSTSYVPRPSLTPSEESMSAAPVPVYVPRQNSDTPAPPPQPAYAPRLSDSVSATPPKGPVALPDIPPALPQRDLPPHVMSTPNGRPLPTGPKVPPTGPRGGFASTPGRSVDSPISTRGGFGAGPPRGFAPRGGFGGRLGDRYEERGGFPYRGRGGFRGRGRGG